MSSIPSEKIITIRRGTYFPKPLKYFGYVGILMGLLTFLENIFLGIGIVALGSFLSFTPWGIQLKAKEKQYRTYIDFIFFKSGKWKSFASFPYLSVLGGQSSETTYGGNTVVSNTVVEKYFDVCILSKNHREKFIINRFGDILSAKKEIEEFHGLLKLGIVTFNPVRSKATRARKR